MVTLTTKDFDQVISGSFLTGSTSYRFGVDQLYELIDQLDFQRRRLDEDFYSRLEEDLVRGCIMPPITLAFVEKGFDSNQSQSDIQRYVNANIGRGMILDGLQRLSALKRAAIKDARLDFQRTLYLNILICGSKDNLLYRMITLNNGQKAMTVRHQIEILTMHMFDFSGYGISVVTEKETEGIRPRGVFKRADMISAYTAFLGNTTSLESSKIIEAKMDELVAKKIIDENITQSSVQFEDVVKLVALFSKDDEAYRWLRNPNNLLPFAVAMRSNIGSFLGMTEGEFKLAIDLFEAAFKGYDVSKIKLARERKKLVQYYLENYSKVAGLSPDDLLLHFIALE